MAEAPTLTRKRTEERVLRRSSSRPALTVLVPVALVALWFVTLAATGSPAGDVVRWFAAVVAAVFAPGFVLVRVSRRGLAPLLEDAAWAVPAGCCVAMVGWFFDRVLPFSAGAYGFGPLMVLLALAIPGTRRRVLARPAPGWGIRPILMLGGVEVVVLGWMLRTGLLAYRPDPGLRGTTYYPDIMYNLDLVGELRHHLAPTYPPVAGATLSYHWFLFAITSHLTTNTGVDAFDATLRLGPASLVPITVLLVAVVARRLAKRVWAGPLAAVLLGAVELSQASRWSTEDGSLGMLPRAWFSSTPQNLGWLAGLAAAGTAMALLRRDPEDRAVPVALLVPFLILAAGSKSPELLVVGGGLGVVAVVHLVRREWLQVRRALVGGVLSLAVFVAAAVTIYRGSSYGLHVSAFGPALDRMSTMFPGYAHRVTSLYISGIHYPRSAVLAETVLWVVPLLPRLLGLLFLVRHRAADPCGWFCLGAVTTGFVAALVTQHPAGSEVYIMQCGYPIGVAGAGGGILLAVSRVRAAFPAAALRRRVVGLLAATVPLGTAVAAVIAYTGPRNNPVVTWRLAHGITSTSSAALQTAIAQHLPVSTLTLQWLRPMLLLALGVLAISAVAAALAWRVRTRRIADRRGLPLVRLSALGAALGAGVFTMIITFHGTTMPVQGSRLAVLSDDNGLKRSGVLLTTRAMFAAGHYVDEHAGADDVVATNMYCRFSRAARDAHLVGCDARNFVASALTARRTLVGGWAYSDRNVDAAWSSTMSYRNEKFWDLPLLGEQFTAFYHPTTALLDDLYTNHHVRWLFADLHDGRLAVRELNALARPAFVRRSTEVWQLYAPTTSTGAVAAAR